MQRKRNRSRSTGEGHGAAVTNGTGGPAEISGRVEGMNIKLPLFLAFPLSIVAAVAADPGAGARALLAKKIFRRLSRRWSRSPLLSRRTPRPSSRWAMALSGRIGEVGLISRAGLAKRSLAAYERAAALDPRSVDARLALVQFHRQAPFFAGGSREKAYAQAKELVALDAWQGNSG